jgi:hypothetical protein
MSRAMFLSLPEEEAMAKCRANDVGVSVVERLPGGGVRLVCMSSDGAEVMRGKFKRHLIAGEVTRERARPRTPLW